MGSESRYNDRGARKRKCFAVKSTATPTNEDWTSASNSASAKNNFLGYSSWRCSCNCC